MNTSSLISAAALLAAAASFRRFPPSRLRTAPPNPGACAPENGVQFVCGVRAAEDETSDSRHALDHRQRQKPGRRHQAGGYRRQDRAAFLIPARPRRYIPTRSYIPIARAAGSQDLHRPWPLPARRQNPGPLQSLCGHAWGSAESIEVFSVDTRGAPAKPDLDRLRAHAGGRYQGPTASRPIRTARSSPPFRTARA